MQITVDKNTELDAGWCPLSITDLDTGEELGWSIKVEIGESTS